MNDADQSWRSVPSWQADSQQGHDYGQDAQPSRDDRTSNDRNEARNSHRFFSWIRESGLVRSDDERWVGGVCGGLAQYLGWSPLLVRALMIGAAFAGGAGLLFYVLAWLLLPECRDGHIMCEDLLAGVWHWSFIGVLCGFMLLFFWPPVWVFGVVVGAFALWLSIEMAGRRALRYAAAFQGNTPEGHVPSITSVGGAASPVMTSPYRPVPPMQKPRYVRRKPAGPLLVLAVVGLIFVSFAVMLMMWANGGVGDLESLLGDSLFWIGGVCVGLGLIIIILGCMGRRSGGLTPFAWIAAIVAASMVCAGIAYSVAYRWYDDLRGQYAARTASGLSSVLNVHGFRAIGSDAATMRRLADGLAVEGDDVSDVLHIDLSDVDAASVHEVTLNDGTTGISQCPAGTIRLAPYRVTTMVTIPDGCSWAFSNVNGTWMDYDDSVGGAWTVMADEYGDMVGSYFGDWDKGVYGDGSLEVPDDTDNRDAGEYYWPTDQGQPNAPATPELIIVVDSSMMSETIVQYESQNTLPSYKEWMTSTESDHE